jgi:hypothetical protein
MRTWTISDALTIGWQHMKRHITLWLLVLLIGLGIMAFDTIGHQIGIGLFTGVVAIAAGLLFDIGITIISLKILDGKKPQIEDVYKHTSFFPDYLIASILYVLIVLGGLLLLIVPGIVWAIKYSLYSFYIVDKKLSPMDAIRASGKATSGHKWHLLGFYLTMIGVNLVGLLALVVGLVATIPTTLVAHAAVYRKIDAHTSALKGLHARAPAKAKTLGRKKKR